MTRSTVPIDWIGVASLYVMPSGTWMKRLSASTKSSASPISFAPVPVTRSPTWNFSLADSVTSPASSCRGAPPW